jgi:methionyl-tRNA formyltransferase
MSIIFFGTPRFATYSLQSLIDSNENVTLVITQPDKKSGRGRKLSKPPVKVLAERNNIEVLQPKSLSDSDIVERLRSLSPEFIIVVAYGKILKENILTIPSGGCINIHASLLPLYRGAAPIQWALINGESTTGVTTMLMDEGMDTGAILLQKELPIENNDTSDTLAQKLAHAGADILQETLSGLRGGRIRPVTQQGRASYAPPLKKEDAKIDWSKSAISLHNFIRGMYPWPCAFTFSGDKYIKIHEALPQKGSGMPGRIESIAGSEIVIGTGEGLLNIKRVQPEGKNVMDASAFINGYRLKEGDFFE